MNVAFEKMLDEWFWMIIKYGVKIFLVPRAYMSVFDSIVEYAACCCAYSCFDILFEYVDPNNTIV
jgi:hypothetical protein